MVSANHCGHMLLSPASCNYKPQKARRRWHEEVKMVLVWLFITIADHHSDFVLGPKCSVQNLSIARELCALGRAHLC